MMLFPADHQITVEELRELVFDDSATPIFDDVRYLAWIDRYPDDWRKAAYAAADRMYGEMAFRPNRLASDGDSIGWTDARITALRDKRDALKAEIDADNDDSFGVVTIISNHLTGGYPGGGTEWH